MNIKYLQLVVAAFTIEIISVLVLAILIALFGPSDPELIQAFSENLAYWLGPTTGFLLVLPESKVVLLDMSVAEGIKYIVSLGAVPPENAGGIQAAFKAEAERMLSEDG